MHFYIVQTLEDFSSVSHMINHILLNKSLRLVYFLYKMTAYLVLISSSCQECLWCRMRDSLSSTITPTQRASNPASIVSLSSPGDKFKNRRNEKNPPVGWWKDWWMFVELNTCRRLYNRWRLLGKLWSNNPSLYTSLGMI